MNLTIPIDVWDPRRGGLERYLSLLADSLHARGHRVTILCMRTDGGATPSEGDASTPTVEVVDVPSGPRWLRELAFARRSVDLHRQSGRDILYAVRHAREADVYQPHGGSYRSAVRTALDGLPLAVRVVKRVLRVLRPTHHVLCWLDGQVFRAGSKVMTLSLSRVVEESLERAFPGAEFRFERIPNGIPLESFHDRDREEQARILRARHSIPAEARVALFLAHQFRAKGLAHLIRALSSAEGWHVVVGGRGRRESFDALAETLGLRERVHFAGAIEDARAAYAGADAFVLPTYYDSCSLSVLESVACGTPAITTRQNGASELIEHGREGFVLDRPSEEDALARALLEIADDGEAFRERARAAATGLSWESHVDRVLDALERRRAEIVTAAAS
jgi:UDP-glucose:(heptosyl)LPS alpha-1,3-glucosyltransferase